jgi:predicted PurR-regulated permease PerM
MSEDSESRLTPFQTTATVAAAGGLALCIVFVLWRILPGILWAFVLSIALWPTFTLVRAWNRSVFWQRLGAPITLTAVIGVLVAAPLAFAALAIVQEAQSLLGRVEEARQHGIAMPEALGQLPWIGSYISGWWQTNLASPVGAASFFRSLRPGNILGMTRNIGPEILHRTLLFGITLLTNFFLFREGEVLWKRLLNLSEKAFGPRSIPIASHVIDAIHATVDGLVLVGIVEGVVIGAGYWVVGVPHAMAFAIVTCILAAIPFGAPITFCAAALLMLANGSVFSAIGLAVFGFVVVFVTDHLIRPIVIGGASRIPFLLVLLGILGGLSSLGLVGLFIGPALMAVFVAVWRDVADTDVPWKTSTLQINDP